MRIDVRPRKRNAPRTAEKSAPAFLQWLRGRNCYIGLGREHTCRGNVRACHVDHAGGKGIGTKVADKHCIPMCDGHHAEQHRTGWRSFETKYAFKAEVVASGFWHRWPGRIAWERKLSDG